MKEHMIKSVAAIIVLVVAVIVPAVTRKTERSAYTHKILAEAC
jgi:hypothetical protein